MHSISPATFGVAEIAAAFVARIGRPAASAGTPATLCAGPAPTDEDPAWG
ncbi:hypothetical protein [Streptomyces rimosus]|nr:hypothetical protein [Streptomyces rimosus]